MWSPAHCWGMCPELQRITREVGDLIGYILRLVWRVAVSRWRGAGAPRSGIRIRRFIMAEWSVCSPEKEEEYGQDVRVRHSSGTLWLRIHAYCAPTHNTLNGYITFCCFSVRLWFLMTMVFCFERDGFDKILKNARSIVTRRYDSQEQDESNATLPLKLHIGMV
ncbi:hypothetical protein Tco_1346134 [Tanacetum coccineum]